MYLGHINHGQWAIMLWPRLALGHGVYPNSGRFKGYIFEYWMTPLIEVRRFKGLEELR